MPGAAAGRHSSSKAKKAKEAKASQRRAEAKERFERESAAANKWIQEFDADKSGALNKEQLLNCMTSIK